MSSPTVKHLKEGVGNAFEGKNDEEIFSQRRIANHVESTLPKTSECQEQQKNLNNLESDDKVNGLRKCKSKPIKDREKISKFRGRVKNKNLIKRRRKKLLKNHSCSLTVSSSFKKTVKRVKTKKSLGCEIKSLKRKTKWSVLGKRNLVKACEFENFTQKGKRGFLGGKATIKSLTEELCEKSESDDDYENGYYHRISLGHFQQRLLDNGLASTSYQTQYDEYYP